MAKIVTERDIEKYKKILNFCLEPKLIQDINAYMNLSKSGNIYKTIKFFIDYGYMNYCSGEEHQRNRKIITIRTDCTIESIYELRKSIRDKTSKSLFNEKRKFERETRFNEILKLTHEVPMNVTQIKSHFTYEYLIIRDDVEHLLDTLHLKVTDTTLIIKTTASKYYQSLTLTYVDKTKPVGKGRFISMDDKEGLARFKSVNEYAKKFPKKSKNNYVSGTSLDGIFA